MRLVPFLLAHRGDRDPTQARAVDPRRGDLSRCSGLPSSARGMAATTVSFWLYDRELRSRTDRAGSSAARAPAGQLRRPRPATTTGRMTRLEHVPALALERKLAYTNDQWSMAGGAVADGALCRRRAASRTIRRRSSPTCSARANGGGRVAGRWRAFPRDAFDYVWLIRPPPYDPALTRGLTPIWRDGTRASLYRVDDAPTRAGSFPADERASSRGRQRLNGVSSRQHTPDRSTASRSRSRKSATARRKSGSGM